MADKLYFEAAADLTAAVAWVYNPYKKLPNGSPYKYVLLQQIDENKAALLAYGSGDAWLYRLCAAHGPIGTTFLFDGGDVAKRVASAEAWKRYPLSMCSTKRNKLKLEAIGNVKEGLLIAGNIELNSYTGDLEDFQLPEDGGWRHFTTIENGWEYLTACSLISKFSKLESKKDCEQVKGVWFRFKDEKLSLTSSEEGNRGNSIICYEVPHYGAELSFAIHGGYLLKTAQVFSLLDRIKVEVDDLDSPTKIKFSGDKGWLVVNTIDPYLVQELSRGAMAMFYEEGATLNEVSSREYEVVSLKDAVCFQIPVSNSTVSDFLIEEINGQLVMSKLYDAEKFEMSTANPWGLDSEGNWTSIVLSYHYMINCLSTLEKFITKQTKSIEYEQSFYEEVDFDNDEFLPLEELGGQQPKLVKLTQKTFKIKNKDRWLLFAESALFPQCKVLVAATLPLFLTDEVEH